mgnify:CR=1 FL=1
MSNLLEKLKELGEKLENKRIMISKEVEDANDQYNDEYMANFKFRKQQEYVISVAQAEVDKSRLIDEYITEMYAERNVITSDEDLKKFNEICRTLDNVKTLAEFELNSIADPIKDNNVLMGMLERKIEKMDITNGQRVYEKFKIFEPLQQKRKLLKGLDEIEKFQDEHLFSHTLQESNFNILWGMRMKIIEENLI